MFQVRATSTALLLTFDDKRRLKLGPGGEPNAGRCDAL